MQTKVRNEQQHAVNFLARLGRTASETHELLKTAYQEDALRKPATRAYVKRFQTLGVDLYKGSPRSKRSKSKAKKNGGVSPAQKVNVTTDDKESMSKTFFNVSNGAKSMCTSNTPNITLITTNESKESQKEIVTESLQDSNHENILGKENLITIEHDKGNIEDADTDIENDDDTYILNFEISNDQEDIYKEYQNEKYSNIDKVNDQILSKIDVYNEALQSSNRKDEVLQSSSRNDSEYKLPETERTTNDVIDKCFSLFGL